jgi:hypothetical protein
MLDDDAAREAWKAAVTREAAPHGAVEFRERRSNVKLLLDGGVMASFFAPVLVSTVACVRAMAAQPMAEGLA